MQILRFAIMRLSSSLFAVTGAVSTAPGWFRSPISFPGSRQIANMKIDLGTSRNEIGGGVLVRGRAMQSVKFFA